MCKNPETLAVPRANSLRLGILSDVGGSEEDYASGGSGFVCLDQVPDFR